MPLQPHNPFFRQLAGIEGKITGEELGGPVAAIADSLDTGFAKVAGALDAHTTDDLVAQIALLAKAQDRGAAAMERIGDNTDPRTSARIALGVALLLLLVDRDGGWDERYGAAKRLKALLKTVAKRDDLATLADDGTDPNRIQQFIRRAPGVLRSGGKDPTDPLFHSVAEEDVAGFVRLLRPLLDEINAAGTLPPDTPTPEPTS